MHHDDYTIEDSDLPDHLIKNSHGETILSQTFPLVAPIRNFSDYRIIENSGRIVNKHFGFFRMEAPILQVFIYNCLLLELSVML